MFNEEKFATYMIEEFPPVFDGFRFYERQWLENTLQWITETYEGKKGTIIAAICSILPEVEEEEVLKFWEDEL